MQLDFEPLELRLRDGWSTARTHNSRIARVVILKLTDPDGAVGWGEAAPISRYEESVGSVTAFLDRIDPARLDANDVLTSMAYLESVSPGTRAAKSAVNCALLDLDAQRAGQPLYDRLGLGFREHHHITSFSIGIDTPEQIQRKVQAADGFQVLKIKLGTDRDEDILRAVREVAPDKWLRVDANEGWKTRDRALRMIEHLAGDGRVELVEQPMPANTPLHDLVWLKGRSPLPLFADESFQETADAPHCAACFHGVNVKLAKTAGLSGAMDALKAAREAGLRTMLGCMVESSLGITAAAHLAEMAECLDLDGHLLIENDPFDGVGTSRGHLSFSSAPTGYGLRVNRRPRE